MGILLSVVLGLLALAFVLQPLYGGTQGIKVRGLLKRGRGVDGKSRGLVEKDGEVGEKDGGKLTPLRTTEVFLSDVGQTERERAARAALHEVELDYQLGNITEADYRALRERYMRRALSELKSRYDREQQLDEVIEEQLRRMKEENEQTTQ